MKASVISLDEIPEALRGEYEEKDGKFLLKLEGDPAGFVTAAQLAEANGKVVEFRDRNTALLNEAAVLAGVSKTEDLSLLKAKLATFEGIDPKEYKELKEKIAELEKKGVKGADDLQVRITSGIGAAIKPLQEQIAKGQDELKKEREERVTAQVRVGEALLRQKIGDEFIKLKGIPNAMDFIVTQAKNTFHVVDDEVKARDTKFSTAKPGEPIGVDEWLAQAVKDYDFAFEASEGGGGRPPKYGDPKPGIKQLVDPTPQQLGEHCDEIAEGKLRVVSKE